MDYEKYVSDFTDYLIMFIPNLLLAIAIVVIGFWIVKKVNKIIRLALEKANVGPEVVSFLGSIIDIIIKFVIVLIAAGVIGFKTSSLIGVLAAAGFAIGLALQGFMGNFASGITVVIFKPYKVGDWVEICDKFGRVISIQIFNTTLITPGQKTLIIPNGQVTDNVITNFSTQGFIKLECKVSMPYAESFPRIKKIILDALEKSTFILHDPAPEVGILEYDSHTVTVVVKPAISPDNYWDATYDVNQRIKAAFSEHKVQVAYSEGIELGTIGQ